MAVLAVVSPIDDEVLVRVDGHDGSGIGAGRVRVDRKSSPGGGSGAPAYRTEQRPRRRFGHASRHGRARCTWRRDSNSSKRNVPDAPAFTLSAPRRTKSMDRRSLSIPETPPRRPVDPELQGSVVCSRAAGPTANRSRRLCGADDERDEAVSVSVSSSLSYPSGEAVLAAQLSPEDDLYQPLQRRIRESQEHACPQVAAGLARIERRTDRGRSGSGTALRLSGESS